MDINEDIHTFVLQISESGSRGIAQSDYFKRKRDPGLWNQAGHENIKLVDLYKQAKELAKVQAKKKTRNDAAEKKYITTHGNCVGVSGQAGIGKTTLTKQLVKKVLNKELLDIDFLFYVSLKKVNYEEKMSVLQFLLTNLKSSWEHDSASDSIVLKQLEESEKVMIIFDGLDEALIELKKQCPNAKLYDATTPEVILKNILNGNILRKAKKLITSRPLRMWQLHGRYRPHYIVNILGISLEAQRQICKNICKDYSETVLIELLNYPELLAQCYVPIICIFTVYWLHQKHLHPDQTLLFPSITNVMLNALENFTTHGMAKSEFELEKLSKLAWEGLSAKKYEFSEMEIKQSELNKESLNAVLITNGQIRLLNVANVTYFSHLILQEFFSAVYLILFLPLCEFKNVLSAGDKRFGNLDGVKNFIFGLCNATTYHRLTHLQSTTFLDNSNFYQKKSFLEPLICNMANLSSDNFPEFFKISKFFKLCSLLYEMQDQELTKKVVEHIPRKLEIDPYQNIFPHDVGSMFYVLQERQKLMEMEMEIWSTTFFGNSREQLMSKLADMPEYIKVSIDKFKYLLFQL